MRNFRFFSSFIIIFLTTIQPDRLVAILTGQQQDLNNQNATTKSNIANSTVGEPGGKLDSNSTFYYDAEAFLVSNKVGGGGSSNEKEQSSNVTTKDPAANEEMVTMAAAAAATTTKKKQLTPPADHRATSARNGRMMDLDAMVGDFAASKVNKERQLLSGNRQSRFLPQPTHLDIAGGKRLHIQGFIPIVGVKDDDDELDQAAEGLHASSTKHRPKMTNTNDLPYGQSSIGHASFGVQRYVNLDDQFNPQAHFADQHQTIAKSGGVAASTAAGSSSVIDSLKKPIKKLAHLASGSGGSLLANEISLNRIGSQPQHYQQHQPTQGCLCVPFYMCKNGYISESSLGKSQVQQLLAQQQQQLLLSPSQQPRQIEPADLTRRGSVLPVPPPERVPQSYPLIDERSFEHEIVTAPSMSGETLDNSYANETLAPLADSFLSMESGSSTTTSSTTSTRAPDLNSERPILGALDTNTTSLESQALSEQTNEYSQEILGRMLGLKSSSSSGAKFPLLGGGGGGGGDAQHQQQASVCGLLRTCCNIQYDSTSSGSRKMFAQIGLNSNVRQQPIQLFHPQQVTPEMTPVLSTRPSQQYGSSVAQQVNQRLQPVNSFPGEQLSSSLVHRSNQYTSQPMHSQAVGQYTRAQTQPLQAFQQQQQQHSPQLPYGQPTLRGNPHQLGMLATAASGQLMQAMQTQPGMPALNLGTRRLLEGRCGLRQSSGITGRVQNLQYHENSADFGEYPAQTAILKRLNGTESLFVCGGTLISQYWVATAAHCIRKHSQSDLKVRLGEWDVNRDDEFYPFVEKEIRDVVVHSEFVAGNLVNDIALLRLDSPVDSSLPHVNPACLPTIDETFTRQRCWVTGWGKDSFGQKGSFQSVLNEVELPVIGHGECEQALRQTRLGPHYRLHSGFICAGGEGGKDACEGDGGSGLYCYQDGLLKVAGLVSWGIGCGQQGVPGVYVNLAHYRPWIENIISIDEDVYSKNSVPAATAAPQTGS